MASKKSTKIYRVIQIREGKETVIVNCANNTNADCFSEWLFDTFGGNNLGDIVIREDTVTPQEYLAQIDSTYLPKLMSIVESVKIKRKIKELDKIFERIHQR